MTTTVSELPLFETPEETSPVIYLAADLGKSDCKFLYWTSSTNVSCLGLGVEFQKRAALLSLNNCPDERVLVRAADESVVRKHGLLPRG